MKHIIKLSLIIILAIVFSCEDSSEPEKKSISQIVLSADKTTLINNNIDYVILKVKDNSKADITEDCEFYADDVKQKNNFFRTSELKEFKLKATYENLTSNIISVTSKEDVLTEYSKKTILEDYTGTWCGWCPQITHLIESFKGNERLIPIAIHQGDSMETSHGTSLISHNGITAYPTAIVNKTTNVQYNWNSLSIENSDIGIGLQTSYSGTSAKIDLKIKFKSGFNEKLKIVICLLENKIIDVQSNYLSGDNYFKNTRFFSLPNKIVDFEHNHVFRKAATDVLGDLIPENNTKNKIEYNKGYTIDLGNYKPENCEIVAYILYDDNQSKSGVENAQKVKLGESIYY